VLLVLVHVLLPVVALVQALMLLLLGPSRLSLPPWRRDLRLSSGTTTTTTTTSVTSRAKVPTTWAG
jgi:hypothetical protein